jgi:hypothetical protein
MKGVTMEREEESDGSESNSEEMTFRVSLAWTKAKEIEKKSTPRLGGVPAKSGTV